MGAGEFWEGIARADILHRLTMVSFDSYGMPLLVGFVILLGEGGTASFLHGLRQQGN
jgi:hypothetical protein